jgi:hypothetical protein
MQSNNKDSFALLGDSEVATVKHTPRDIIPESVHFFENDGEVSSIVAREKTVDVFKDNGSWAALSHQPCKVVKESRLFPSKPRSRAHSSEAEVLARKSCGPNRGIWDGCFIDLPNVMRQGHSRPMLF